MPGHLRGYFLTWRTYGTWLHGDDRGSVSRQRNTPGTPLAPPDPGLEQYERSAMRGQPVVLTGEQRRCVHAAIEDACDFRGWNLLAANVRTNHVHVVLEAGESPELVMMQMKKRATRMLREQGLMDGEHPVWARHGSTRYLWTEQDLEGAVYYVVYGQDKVAEG